jgi:PAS domain S-box-containing protein
MVQALWAGAALLLLGGGGLLAWKLVGTERRSAIASHRVGLHATAELKSEAVRHWHAERWGAARLRALSPRLAHPTHSMGRGVRVDDHRRALQAELDRLRRECSDCVALTVVDLEGRVLARSASSAGEAAPDPALPPWSGTSSATGFQYDPANGRIRLTMVAPILDDDDDGAERTYGHLAVELNPATHLIPLLQSWPTASRTGELGLAERRGEEVVILNMSRGGADAAQVLHLPTWRVQAPAVRATRGEVGNVDGVDYRGIEVLAEARRIEGTAWSLVAKEDLDEVLASYREKIRLYAVALAGLALAVLGLLAFLRQRRRVASIRREGAALTAELEERRRLNLELARSELRFRSLVLASAQIVWTSNAAGEVVEPLPTWQAYTGMTPEQIRGFGWLAAIHPDDALRVEQVWRHATGTRTSFQIRYRIRGQDGQYRSFEVQGLPVTEPDGRVAEWIGTCTDISQRLKAAEALRSSEDYLRRLVESLGVGLVVHAADTSIITSNPEASRVLGLSPDQLRGLTAVDPAWRFLREDGTTLPVEEYPVNRVLSTRQPFSDLVFGVDRGDGSPPRWVLVKAYPAWDGEGRLEHVVVSFSDVTDQRLAEAKAARLAEHLRISQKIEALGRLAGGVAHDFNNLLSVILGHTAFALDLLGDQDPVREDLLEVEKAGRRAAALTSQLLAFGRRQVLQPRALDLNQVVAELEKMLRRVIGEDIRLEQSLADGLWPTMADPAQLEQVIMNLVLNARDAMPAGGRLVLSTANLEEGPGAAVPPGAYVVLTVSDSGSGFDETTRARMFEPFFTTKPLGKGTGLGLSTVYGIVSQSGGHVQVESEPGRGATFRVLLPRAPVVERPEAALPATAGPSSRGTETVLVVEDERAVRDVARRILEAAGYRVLTAEGGEAALRLCREHAGGIDLLLSDVVMPQMGGPECAAEAERLRPGLRVLFMSGYADDAIAHQGVLQPGTRLVQKPFSAAELTRQVRAALDDAAVPAPGPAEAAATATASS